MKAKVTVAFPGCPDGQIKPRTIEVGEVIEGDLAQVAVDQKWAEPVKDRDEPKAEQPAASKGKRR